MKTVGKRIIVSPLKEIKDDGLIGGNDIELYKVICVGNDVSNISIGDSIAVHKKNILNFKVNKKQYFMCTMDNVLLSGNDGEF